MKIQIIKPKNECEGVNLFDAIATSLQRIDPIFPEYFLEPNIMDDADFDEAMALFQA